MRTKKPWMTLLAVLAALSLVAAACGDDDGDTSASDTTEQSDDTGATDDTSDDSMTDDTMNGDTGGDMVEPVGEACAAIPEDGPGSSAGMAEDTAGTAASNNPVLSTLVEAVTAAGLVDALNDPDATYTIFAPANDAFEALPEGTLEELTAPEGIDQLTDILTYHVYAGGELSADDLADEDSLTMLNEQDVEISVDGDTVTVNGDAMVICGNVTTANATVHIIDSVLMPEE